MAGFRAQPRFPFSFNMKTGKLKRTNTGVLFQTVTKVPLIWTEMAIPELITDTYSIDNNQGKISSGMMITAPGWWRTTAILIFVSHRYSFPDVISNGSRSGHDQILSFHLCSTGTQECGNRMRKVDVVQCKGRKTGAMFGWYPSDEGFSNYIDHVNQTCAASSWREGGIIERYDTSLTVVERKKSESPGSTFFNPLTSTVTGTRSAFPSNKWKSIHNYRLRVLAPGSVR